MDNLKQKSTNEKLKFQVKVKTNRQELIIGSIVATFIAITPYLFTLWEGVPDKMTWDTFLFSYTSPYYESVQIFVWTLLGKLIPLLLLVVWMFTCRHWWYHVLIVPIAMYTYHIIEIVNDDIVFTEENQILYLLPVMAIVIPSIYLIRARMFNKLNEATKSLEELEEEFMMKPKTFWGKVKQYF